MGFRLVLIMKKNIMILIFSLIALFCIIFFSVSAYEPEDNIDEMVTYRVVNEISDSVYKWYDSGTNCKRKNDGIVIANNGVKDKYILSDVIDIYYFYILVEDNIESSNKTTCIVAKVDSNYKIENTWFTTRTPEEFMLNK